MFLERDSAVVKESSRREQEESEGACALEASTEPESSTAVVLYPKLYAADVERMQR